MAALQTAHVVERQLSVAQIGAACKGSLSAYAAPALLTNTTIAAAGTNAGLQAAVTAAAAAGTFHATDRYFAPRVNLAITLGLYSTELSDSGVSGVTTGAGLVGLTWADPNVTQGANYPPN